ncbi:hypothetical protein TRIP_C60524 [Candidatus Zixiibacteriota bacterium]|nr:hypothetical protein TRIP_C60524 [candidate division Zixibacteria bacterium]
MGFSSDQLIQIGLNFAGFLTAGLLTAVVYSLWTERRTSRIGDSGTALAGASNIPVAPSNKDTDTNIEFISLRENSSRPRRGRRAADAAPVDNRTRDRQEIIRLAKEMLSARKSNSEIRKVLKVTDGELSFLKQNMNLQGIARNR